MRPPDITGKSAGLQLFPVGDAHREVVGEVWFARDEQGPFMGRTPFINNFLERLTLEEAENLAWAAMLEDWADVDRFHPEALPWYCRECGCNYAQSSWRITERFDEDGWLDSYRGHCPEGHERMIAD